MAKFDKAALIASLKEQKAKAEELADKRNELNENGKFEEAHDVEIELEQVVNKYTSDAKSLAYNTCKFAKNPMVAACKAMNYTTIRVKENDIEGSTQTELEIVDAIRPIKLRELHKKCKDGIGSDKKWIYAVEKFNQLMTARQGQRLRVKIAPEQILDTYYMNDLSRKISLGKADLLSEENIKENLTQVVQMMIGKTANPDETDVYHLIDTYAKADKKKSLKVICSNHEALTREFQIICHHIITNGDWDIDFKTVK